MAREINLVPDIKNDMIHTLKMRNLVFFISIVIGIFCGVVLFLLGTTVAGQEIAKNGKKTTLDLMSKKIEENKDDLEDFVTIRNQLTNLSEITSKKQVLSRTFNIINALFPHGADKIWISELVVNMDPEKPTLSFDAQADAGKDPYIDYNVLDAFRKSMEYMHYDYGTYVDKDGNDIPAYCIIENNVEDGSILEENDSTYALWTISGEGCNPGNHKYVDATTDPANKKEGDIEPEDINPENKLEDNPSSSQNKLPQNNLLNNSNNNNSDDDNNPDDEENPDEDDDDENPDEDESEKKDPNAVNYDAQKRTGAYETELYGENQSVVRIWRTPQFEKWYNEEHMTLEGTISGVPHFNSKCIQYSGKTVEEKNDKGKMETKVEWNDTNECRLVPDKDDGSLGIDISDSSNARGSGNNLVLRFSAIITLDPAVYLFNNFHMLALGPDNVVNVTDSYVQIQSMFGAPAQNCDPGDTACTNNTINLNGG